MPCQIGITTDPEERIAYWGKQVYNLRDWALLDTGLTYEQAIAAEAREVEQRKCAYLKHGQRPFASYGQDWSVYYFQHDGLREEQG